MAHPVFRGVKVIKVNPDSPQRWVRKLALERGITVVTPTPRLKGAFRVLDPREIPKERYAQAATLKRGGRRLGKGHGYADLEYGLLRELGNPAVPVVTTVHPLQVLENFPTESHDLPVRLIATPDALITVKRPPAPPRGIEWKRLPAQALEDMPVLGELKRLLASRRAARRRRKAGP